MTQERFWALIAAARAQAGADIDARVDALQDQLSPLDARSLVSFQIRYDALIRRAYRWDLWGAAYLMLNGCAHDGFRHFCDWLISEGRAVFDAALLDPDSLAEAPRQRGASLELFGYVAMAVHEQKFGTPLQRDRSTDLALPAGEEWLEAQLPHMFPRLAAKYW